MIDDILKEFEKLEQHEAVDCEACDSMFHCPFEDSKKWLSQKLTAYGEEQRREGRIEGLERAIKATKTSCYENDSNQVHQVVTILESELTRAKSLKE